MAHRFDATPALFRWTWALVVLMVVCVGVDGWARRKAGRRKKGKRRNVAKVDAKKTDLPQVEPEVVPEKLSFKQIVNRAHRKWGGKERLDQMISGIPMSEPQARKVMVPIVADVPLYYDLDAIGTDAIGWNETDIRINGKARSVSASKGRPIRPKPLTVRSYYPAASEYQVQLSN